MFILILSVYYVYVIICNDKIREKLFTCDCDILYYSLRIYDDIKSNIK